jgi:peptidoglycan/xylan/chitin deacetylase (PgdA/CDA1 family)
MRLDRVVTLGVIHPLRRFCRQVPSGESGNDCLPILMYHSICEDPEPTTAPYYKVCTSPRRFAEHLNCLEALGCRGVTLSEGLSFLNRKSGFADSRVRDPEVHPVERRTLASAVSKPVALVFDDGFRDFYTAAYPILRSHGFAATMNLPTAFIGTSNRIFKGRECLTWSEVRELHHEGIEFGAHTVNHPRLAFLPWTEIRSEVSDSKKEIEDQLGAPVRTFAYPYDYPQSDPVFCTRFRELLASSGLESSVTTIVGRATPRNQVLELPRLPVNTDDDSALLAAKLQGSYDWFALPQALVKRIRRQLRRNHPRQTKN